MILDEIVARKRADVAAREASVSAAALEELASESAPRRSLWEALDLDGVGVIAEIKRASPVAGIFAEDLDPAEWAKLYEDNGAVAISVLTDAPYFKGSLDDLKKAREACNLPVIRKDFLLGPYQILEAAAAGADAVLLIVGLTEEQDLARDLGLARDFGMRALVEVHAEDDIDIALNAGARILGINNRDLRSFKTDLAVTERLCAMIPSDITIVSESGVRTAADVRRLTASGVSGVLVGESIMTADNPAARVAELVRAGEA